MQHLNSATPAQIGHYEHDLWQTYGEEVSLLAQIKNIFDRIKR